MKKKTNWTAELFMAALSRYFKRWKRDRTHGQPAGKPWCRRYIRRYCHGNGFLSALYIDHLEPEIYLRRLGGEMWDQWVRLKKPWDREQAIKELQRALRDWHTDKQWGMPAGRHFSVTYLMRTRYNGLVRAILRHVGSVTTLVREIPDIRDAWYSHRSLGPKGLAAALTEAHRMWQRDPRGRDAKMPFGKEYLRRNKFAWLYAQVAHRGIRRIVARCPRSLQRNWARRPVGMYTTAVCIRRAELYGLVSGRLR